jgi:oligoendopeptidase F
MDDVMEKTDEIIKDYKGMINTPNFTAQNLHDLLEKYEETLASQQDLGLYSITSFDANMTLPEPKALYNKYIDFQSTISKKFAFIELEIGKLVTNNPQIIEQEILSNYIYYLNKVRRKFPYKLSETEEQLILDKDQYGSKAWEQLSNSRTSSRKFKAIVEGKEEIISISDFRSLIQHPDRETRKSVFKSVYSELRKDEETYSSALRNICGDWVKTSKHRAYNNPIHKSLMDNDTTQEILDNLMNTVESNIDIYQKFLKIKAKLLNLPKLDGVDVFALLPFDKKYTWNEAKKISLQVYNKFDNSFGNIVSDIFERKHVDAFTREGKKPGAWCYQWYNGRSVFILMPFKGLLNDIIGLTHELGHGIHNYLSCKEQTYLNFMPGMTVVETASTFGELLLADHFLEISKSTNEKITCLTNQLGMGGILIFLLSSWMLFEQSLYDAIERGEYLDGKTISKYWCIARDKMYGDTVECSDEMKWEWTHIPHYYMASRRFYNYPYVYAQLFVYALYQTYKNEGENFVPKFKRLLKAGGSVSPEELGRIVGLDITTSDFWNLGMDQYRVFVEELEKLTK